MTNHLIPSFIRTVINASTSRTPDRPKIAAYTQVIRKTYGTRLKGLPIALYNRLSLSSLLSRRYLLPA
ncbi:hypothetical protein PM082_021214 [Marasmius tenuissimus]|nr:hypothetical protein PM082_021214 [Marasmius tenuissimus]